MSQPVSLDNKTALVTGSARRLGRALALALGQAGAHVVVHYRSSPSDAREVVSQLQAMGVQGWHVGADLEEPGQAARLFSEAQDLAGPIDILINNASIFPEDRLDALTADTFHRNMAVHALAPVVLSRALAAQGHGGAIVNMLDARITDFDAEHVSYHLSKRTLADLTRIMAVAFAPSVRVNGVAPGLVLPPDGREEDYLKDLAHTNLLNSYGSAEDVCRTVLFLLRSPFITGQTVFVDGGRNLRGSMYD